MPLTRILGLVVAVISVTGWSAQSLAISSIEEFLVQDVCLDGANRVTEEIPAIDKCAKSRPIVEGERAPYVLQTWGNPDDQTSCASKDGNIRKINVPVTKGSETHIGSFFDKGYGEPCKVNYKMRFGEMKTESVVHGEPFTQTDKISLYKVVDGYASILYSASSEGGTYYHTPKSKNHMGSYKQFANGWILAAKNIPARKANGESSVRYVTSESFQYNDDKSSVKSVFNKCPTNFKKAFTLWARSDFKYRSGDKIDSVISHHYSAAHGTKAHPGAGASVEKLYFAKGLGLIRWEVWKREDYANSAANLKKGQVVVKARAYGTEHDGCGKPYDLPAAATPGMSTGPVGQQQGAYFEKIKEKGTNKSYIWYMTECDDYSNFKKNSALKNEKNYNGSGYLPEFKFLLNGGSAPYFFK